MAAEDVGSGSEVEELSDAEKARVGAHFMMSAPPGQLDAITAGASSHPLARCLPSPVREIFCEAILLRDFHRHKLATVLATRDFSALGCRVSHAAPHLYCARATATCDTPQQRTTRANAASWLFGDQTSEPSSLSQRWMRGRWTLCTLATMWSTSCLSSCPADDVYVPSSRRCAPSSGWTGCMMQRGTCGAVPDACILRDCHCGIQMVLAKEGAAGTVTNFIDSVGRKVYGVNHRTRVRSTTSHFFLFLYSNFTTRFAVYPADGER